MATPRLEGTLRPEQVAVVANSNVPASIELAKQYLAARGIPPRQLLLTAMPDGEAISRHDYEKLIAAPLKDFLTAGKLDQVCCVALLYGVPLKVLEPELTPDGRQTAALIRDERQRRLSELIQLITQTRALASEPDSADLTEADDPRASAANQIQYLLDQLLQAFTDAAGRIAKNEKTRASWLALWTRAFGYTAPESMDIANAPAPPVTPEQRESAARQIGDTLAQPLDLAGARELLRLAGTARGAAGVLELCELLMQRANPDWKHRAAVDSELTTLFWPPFTTAGAAPNPLCVHTHAKNPPGRTLMVARLDGPTSVSVKRMIETSVQVERTGLKGQICIDARGIAGEGGYGSYDEDLRRLAKMIEEFGKPAPPVLLDNQPALFQPGTCKNVALYCGWYSLGKYVDAFEFAPGAVAWHIASTEAMRLHDPQATTWCPRLLAAGAAATLGPVEEPYLNTFPLPSEFFGLLLTGRLTLVQCYYKTLPRVSWMLTLIGDPLYNPYAAHPVLEPEVLPDALFDELSDRVEQ